MNRRYEVVVYELQVWPGEKKRREWRDRHLGGFIIEADRELEFGETLRLAAAEAPAPMPEVDRAR